MSSSNHVSSLLANEKLTSENYMKWKSNLNIVLICENHKFVLTEECPEVPLLLPKLQGKSLIIDPIKQQSKVLYACEYERCAQKEV